MREELMSQENTALKEKERHIREVEVEVQEILRITNLVDQDQDHKASISNKKVSKLI